MKWYDSQDISNTSWALAKLGRDSILLLKIIHGDSMQFLKGMNSQAIANVVLAFANLDYKINHYFNVLENNIDMFLRSMMNQDIWNILLVFGHIRIDRSKQNDALHLVGKTTLIDLSMLSNDSLSQLDQVFLHAMFYTQCNIKSTSNPKFQHSHSLLTHEWSKKLKLWI